MKAPAFRYIKPPELSECLTLLAAHGDDAQILAGGQSLMPMLNLRLAAPAVLIDIGGLSELKDIKYFSNHLTIGALATHAEMAASETIKRHAPLLADAAPHIAHLAIRARGTIGGSIALADPAAEWPACCLALNAEIELASVRGTRLVRAEDFFQGLYSTDRQPDELITSIRIPLAGSQQHHIFSEVAQRRGDFAIAGLAFVCQSRTPSLSGTRMVFFGVDDRPVLAARTMSAINGTRLSADDIGNAAAVLSAELDPPEDPAYPAPYRRRIASVLLERALSRVMEDVTDAS